MLTGVGKSGLIARKIAATLSSIGTSSTFLHPVEALHGDIGLVQNGDTAILLSKSGTTEELTKLIPYLKFRGANIISILGNVNSTIARYSDAVLNATVSREACPFNLAPTSSSTLALVYGDALAMVVMKLKGTTLEDFSKLHPLGLIGKSITVKVEDVMQKGLLIPFIDKEAAFKNAIIEISNKQLEIAKLFYDKLCNLHLSGKNGFWPIILKNSFAPLFSHDKFDVVIGNPPWITWKAMSDTYRKLTLDIWLSYGIFEKSAYDKITSHDDFAMAVTYVCIDHYLKKDGITAFVLPQTFVKSLKGGEGFRKFEITRDGLNIPFSINEVYDMLKISPFKGEATNRTSVYVFQKNKKMLYPMHNYFECENVDKENTIKYTDTYDTVKHKLKFKQLSAQPINNDIRSPWLTVKKNIIKNLNYFLGKSPYRARKGIEPCGAKGVYLIKINKRISNNIQIENLIERSRLEKAKKLGVHIGKVEKDFIYPMVGGRNFDKWGLNSHFYMIVPHANTGKGIYRGLDEKELKTKYKKTYEWLFYFKDLLLETRIRSGKFFDPKQYPFYRLDNVGEYTFSKYKLLWKEQSRQMTTAVVSSLDDDFLGEKTIVTDSKVLYVSFDTKEEANYLCAILNSRLIGEIIEAYTIDVQKGVDIVKNMALVTKS